MDVGIASPMWPGAGGAGADRAVASVVPGVVVFKDGPDSAFRRRESVPAFRREVPSDQ